MEIYRTFRIHASRFLPNLNDNHICKKMHGHTFNITIYVKGKINKVGFVMDFYDIDEIFKNNIHSIIDHRVLNDIKDLENPTSENLSIWIWENIKKDLPILSKIIVSEDFGTGIIYKGKSTI